MSLVRLKSLIEQLLSHLKQGSLCNCTCNFHFVNLFTFCIWHTRGPNCASSITSPSPFFKMWEAWGGRCASKTSTRRPTVSKHMTENVCLLDSPDKWPPQGRITSGEKKNVRTHLLKSLKGNKIGTIFYYYNAFDVKWAFVGICESLRVEALEQSVSGGEVGDCGSRRTMGQFVWSGENEGDGGRAKPPRVWWWLETSLTQTMRRRMTTSSAWRVCLWRLSSHNKMALWIILNSPSPCSPQLPRRARATHTYTHTSKNTRMHKDISLHIFQPDVRACSY